MFWNCIPTCCHAFSSLVFTYPEVQARTYLYWLCFRWDTRVQLWIEANGKKGSALWIEEFLMPEKTMCIALCGIPLCGRRIWANWSVFTISISYIGDVSIRYFRWQIYFYQFEMSNSKAFTWLPLWLFLPRKKWKFVLGLPQ